MNRPLRVLSLQPYFGGSHQQFHNGWVDNSRHQWATLTLPPRHWKWRMRHASIHFAQQLVELVADGKRFDVILCTDMLNLAEFKGLIGRELDAIPTVVYFHENQFAYPTQANLHRDEHLCFTNFITALAADKIWFNSRFNFDSMLQGLNRRAGRWPDYQPNQAIASLVSKLEVQHPGIQTPPIDVGRFLQKRVSRAASSEPMHIVWAARWEHDKNPQDFLAALKMIAQNSIPFRLSVIGQTFRNVPPVFEEIHDMFSDRIVRWGFQETRQQYWEALAGADVFVSTAKHEFFGLSVAEAVAAGLHPVVPHRLAYPELLGLAADSKDLESFFYDGTATGLAGALSELQNQRVNGVLDFDLTMAAKLTNKLSWNRRAAELDDALAVVSSIGSPNTND